MASVSNLLHTKWFRPRIRCVSHGAQRKRPNIKKEENCATLAAASELCGNTALLSTACKYASLEPKMSYRPTVSSVSFSLHASFPYQTGQFGKKKICFPDSASFSSVSSSSDMDSAQKVSNTIGYSMPNHNGLLQSSKELMETPTKILEAAAFAENDGSPQINDLSCIFSSYTTAVYDTVKFPFVTPELEVKREQLRMSIFHANLLKRYTTDPQFENLMSLTEEYLIDLPLVDCLCILYSLNCLFISKKSDVVDRLNKHCLNNIDVFDFHQLALLASCQDWSSTDFVALGKITQAAKNRLIELPPHEIDLKDLCDVFLHMKRFISKDMIGLGVDVIMSHLKCDPSNITLSMLSNISLFNEITDKESTEVLANKMFRFPANFFQNVDSNEGHLTFNSCSAIGKNPNLFPLYRKMKNEFLTALRNSDISSFENQVKLSLILNRIPVELMDILEQCVKDSDNFLLFQLMDHHLRINVVKQPAGRKLLYSYHSRLIKLSTELDRSQLGALLWENNGAVAQKIFKMLEKMQLAGLHMNKDLREALDKQLYFRSLHYDSPKAKVFLMVSKALDFLKNNVPLTSFEFSALMRMINRLDFDEIVKINARAESLVVKGSASALVRRQAQQLRQKLPSIFDDQLARMRTIVPSVSNDRVWLSPSYKQYFFHARTWGLSDRIVNNFPRFTVTGEEKNCLRILHALDVLCSEDFAIFQENTFEDLIRFVTHHPELQIYSGLQLLKVLSYAGYQPDSESFYRWALHLALSVMERDTFSKIQQVEMAHHLSLLGIFPEEILDEIFSLDFIMELEVEWKEVASPGKEKRTLGLLNRSVCVECPHLSLPWFGHNLLVNNNGDEQILMLERMIDSVARVCGGSQYIVAHTESPYGHPIDAAIYFDADKTPVRQKDPPSSVDNSMVHERLALLYLDHKDFCHDSYKLTGRQEADIRQLEMLGYLILLVPHFYLSSMELHNEENLDNFMRTKINQAMSSGTCTHSSISE